MTTPLAADGRARVLAGGVEMPVLGLGVWLTQAGQEAEQAVAWALEAGYRHVDTAQAYENEASVGAALRASGVPRDEVFVTTKFLPSQRDPERELEGSLERLGLDRVDLYLVHWPLPRLDRYVESWLVMEELRAEGLATSIGVSNFLPEHLDRLAAASSTVPAVNQIELHPRDPQHAQRADDARRGIVTEAWSPLAMGGLLGEPVLAAVGQRHGVTPAQVVLRWHVQQGIVTIPKAGHVDRLRANLDVFDFTLTPDDLARIATLETGRRVNDQDPRTWEEF